MLGSDLGQQPSKVRSAGWTASSLATPVYQQLVDAWEVYLRRVHELTASMFPAAGGFAQWVPWLLWRHVMQRGRAMLLTLKFGYSEEALEFARPMMSAAMALRFIVTNPNPGGWALRYWLQLDEREREFIDLQERLARITPDQAVQLRKNADEARRGLYAPYGVLCQRFSSLQN